MKILSTDTQIKSAHCGYRDQANGIISIHYPTQKFQALNLFFIQICLNNFLKIQVSKKNMKICKIMHK